MNYRDLHRELKAGNITIDYKEHLCNDAVPGILRQIENMFDDEKATDVSEEMRGYFTKILDAELKIGSRIRENDYVYCFMCGDRHSFILTGEKTLSLYSTTEYMKIPMPEDRLTGRLVRAEDIPVCSMSAAAAVGKLVAEISVPSGKLIFTNYFDKEEIYSLDKADINCVAGRYELMKHLAEKNIGYGQMGNMSVSVFVNAAKDEIIIGGNYAYTEDDEEIEIEHPGYTELGSISLSVWRWMCGDAKILKQHGEELPKIKYGGETCTNYRDYVGVKVQPGTWVIEHYYDFGNDDSKIYSKLYLKK